MHEVRKTLAFMLRVAWREKPALFGSYLILFVGDTVAAMKNVLIPKLLLDELLLVTEGAPLSEHLRLIVLYAALTVAIDVLVRATNGAAERTKGEIAQWFQEYCDMMIGEHAMKMDYEHTEDPDALDQLNKAREGMSWYSGGVVGILDCVHQIALNAAVLCGVTTLIFTRCPLLLPIQLVALLMISWLTARNNEVDTRNFLRLSKINRIFGYVLFQLASFEYGKDIRLYDSSRMMGDKAKEQSDGMTDIWKEQAYEQLRYSWGIDAVNVLRDGISYFYIGMLAVRRVISIGDFTMCMLSATQLYNSLQNMIVNVMEIKKRCSYAYQFVVFLDYPAAMQTGERSLVDTGSDGHVITFCDVSFRYPRSDKYVLRHLNLTIRPGEHLSIVGLNGAGKTTFIKLLCRLYEVTEGEICIDGINIMEYSEEEYRKLFAVVFQDFKLFAFSLRENVAPGVEDIDEERLEQVLTQTGLYEDAQKLPDGLDTMIYKSFDEKGVELSGGQQQKTAISRALYRDAPIVILDEPTAALDPIAEYEIYRQFHALVGGKTAIYISHRLSSCRFCDHIAVFAEETVKEYGTHDELVARADGIYAEMFRAQAQYYVDSNGI